LSPKALKASNEKWAAIGGETVTREGNGATLDDNSPIGNTFLAYMREDETLQAILRFGRDEEGAVVFAHTSALDLTVPEGIVYGFLGPNEAGKTTTMRMLTTLTTPTDGTARIAGHPITDRQAVVPHIGYLPEEPPLYDELTGREHLEYIAGLRDIPDSHSQDRIESLLDRFGLSAAANKRISTYSKGMKQKTGLIQALLHEPSVVFLSTHILPVVEEVADRVGVLYDGSLVAEGAPDTLTDQVASSLEDVFLDLTDEQTADPVAAEVGE
jgi:ABC-2 type transport system ATP-binding protein